MKNGKFEIVEKDDGKMRLIINNDVDGISTIGFLLEKKDLYSLYTILRDFFYNEDNN